MSTNASMSKNVSLPNRDAQTPAFKPPEWAESVHGRAMAYFRNLSTSGSSNLSHADMTATLACVVRAGLYLENQNRQPLSFLPEVTQSSDMSIVTLSPADIRSSLHFQSADSSPPNPSTLRTAAAATPTATRTLLNSSDIPLNHVTPSSSVAQQSLSPSYVGTIDDPISPADRHMTSQSHSFTFSPQRSPIWTASDEAALQPVHHHPAHYPLLLDVFRSCWALRNPNRQCLPSEEAAVVAAFLLNYPLPGASAPVWEISEFTGASCYALHLPSFTRSVCRVLASLPHASRSTSHIESQPYFPASSSSSFLLFRIIHCLLSLFPHSPQHSLLKLIRDQILPAARARLDDAALEMVTRQRGERTVKPICSILRFLCFAIANVFR